MRKDKYEILTKSIVAIGLVILLIGAAATIAFETNRQEDARRYRDIIYLKEAELLNLLMEGNLTNEDKLSAISIYTETAGIELQMQYYDWIPIRNALFVLIIGNILFSLGLTLKVFEKREILKR